MTDMRKIYYPQKLNKEVIKLEKIFGSSAEKNHVSKKRLEQIIRGIINCSNEDELKLYVFALSKPELKAVAIYMKSNYLHVDLNKILDAFVVTDAFYCFQIIYDTWQQNYRKPYKKEAVLHLVKHYNDNIVEKYNLNDVSVIATWMSNKDAEVSICKYLAPGCESIEIFEKRLEQIQIKKKYSLHKNIMGIFLCYCDAEVYLGLGDEVLLSHIKVLDLEQQRKILYNFLVVVNPDHFDKFEILAQYAYDRLFGGRADNLYKETMGKQPENIKEAYDALINIFWLIKLFGRDRRSRFWKKYIREFKVRYYSAHDMLLMEFNRCSVIEFKSMGPIYFFDTDYFSKAYVKKGMSQKTPVFKSDLYYDSKAIYRKTHQGYWERDVAHMLNLFAL